MVGRSSAFCDPPMYAISIQSSFIADHALRLPGGALEDRHGHDWPVEVWVTAQQLDEIETVMDFHPLHAQLDLFLARWRFGYLNSLPPFADGTGALVISPSAERVAWAIGQAVLGMLPAAVKLEKVRVGEAPGCFAEWRHA